MIPIARPQMGEEEKQNDGAVAHRERGRVRVRCGRADEGDPDHDVQRDADRLAGAVSGVRPHRLLPFPCDLGSEI